MLRHRLRVTADRSPASALLLLDRAVQELIGRTIRLTDVFCRPEIEGNQVTIEGTQHDAAA